MCMHNLKLWQRKLGMESSTITAVTQSQLLVYYKEGNMVPILHENSFKN